MVAPVHLHNLEVNMRFWLYSSQWMGCTHQHMLTLTPWTSQQVGGSEMGQKCQTHTYVSVKISRHLTPHFALLWNHILYSFLRALLFSCLSSSVSSNSRFPSFCCSSSLAPVLNYWDRLKQLLSALRQSWERQKRKEKRQKRGRYGGQTHPCLKMGFCREPQAGCQVCRSCKSGRFLTLWE